MGKHIVSISTALLLLGVVRLASGQTQYSLTDLGPLAGDDAWGVNISGQVVGGKNFGSGINGFLYNGGVMQSLGTLSPSQSYSFAYSINNAGVIVGVSQQSSTGGQSFPFIYSGGTMSQIPGLGGSNNGSANCINNLGQVAGISANSDGVTDAFLYSGGTTVDLGNLSGSGSFQYSDAYGINDRTQVVGATVGPQGSSRAFLWQNGTMTDLGDLYGGSGNAAAYGINNLGEAVGVSWQNFSSPQYAVLWDDGTITDLGVLPGTNWSNAQAINDSGVAVGTSFASDGSIHRMFVWDSVDGMQDADNLLDSSGAGWTLYGARGINDLGQIVGYGESPSGQIDGVLLTPVPEPPTLALLALGFICFAAYARRAT